MKRIRSKNEEYFSPVCTSSIFNEVVKFLYKHFVIFTVDISKFILYPVHYEYFQAFGGLHGTNHAE